MHSYTKLFQPYLLKLAEQHRQKQHLSQEHMAELLRITPRSYSALKNGQNSLSASVLLLLLLLLPEEEVLQFLQKMRTVIKEADHNKSLEH